jgi:hypothetical protein
MRIFTREKIVVVGESGDSAESYPPLKGLR